MWSIDVSGGETKHKGRTGTFSPPPFDVPDSHDLEFLLDGRYTLATGTRLVTGGSRAPGHSICYLRSTPSVLGRHIRVFSPAVWDFRYAQTRTSWPRGEGFIEDLTDARANLTGLRHFPVARGERAGRATVSCTDLELHLDTGIWPVLVALSRCNTIKLERYRED